MEALTSVCLSGSGISFCSSGNFADIAPLPGVFEWRCPLSLIERVMTHSSSTGPASESGGMPEGERAPRASKPDMPGIPIGFSRSEEHTSELQSQSNLVCRLLLEKKKKRKSIMDRHTTPSADAHIEQAEPP